MRADTVPEEAAAGERMVFRRDRCYARRPVGKLSGRLTRGALADPETLSTADSEGVPRLSIGLPVYNGERYLEESIDSILAQTFTDFELIICDNDSTDATAAICRRYADADPRVKYHRNAENIGGANNHNLTFELSRAGLFRWASYDDVCAPELLERCIAALDADPAVTLCYSAVASIDEDGERIEVISRNNADGERPHQRFAGVAGSRDYCEETYGVIRSEVFGSTRLQQSYTGSDRTLLSEIALHGPFHQVPEVLFFKRMHEKNRYVNWRTRITWFDPTAQGRIVFPFWTQFIDYLRTIHRVPISVSEKVRCHLFMARWFVVKSPKLAKDLLVAGYMLGHRPEWRRRTHRKTENWEWSRTEQPTTTKRVGVMGFFGYGNLGDEALQDAVLQNVGERLADVEFVGFSLDPADTEARHGIRSFPLSRTLDIDDEAEQHRLSVRLARRLGASRSGALRRLDRWVVRIPLEFGLIAQAFRHVGDLDALIVSGSGPLNDYWGGGGALSFPYTLAKWGAIARLRRVPFLVVSVGAGPIHSRLSAAFIRTALRCATYRSYRDEFSKQLVSDDDFGADDPVTPDLAHSLHDDGSKAVRPPTLEGDGRLVGLNVMGYRKEGCWPDSDAEAADRHIDKYTEFVMWLAERGDSVVLLPGEAHFDQLVFDDLLASLDEAGIDRYGDVVFRPPIADAGELLSWLRTVDLVVASRFHVVLLGMRTGTPAIAVSYQEKIDALMESTGFAEHCHQIDDFGSADLQKSLEAIEPHLEDIGTSVSDHSQKCEAALGGQYDHIIELI